MEQRPTDRITPLLILLSVYGLTWIDLFLPQPAIGLFTAPWFAASAAKNLARIGFLAFAMRLWQGIGALGTGIPGRRSRDFFPKARDMADGILIAAAAGLFALGFALLALLAGAGNPLLYPFSGLKITTTTFPLMIASSLAIGYSEELFFRFFAPKALERAGASPQAAILGAALLFGASHGSQGIFGMIGAAILALLFSFFRTRGKGLHALALGHALYDFVILLAVAQVH